MNTTKRKGDVTRTKEENTNMLLEGFGGAVIAKHYLQASCKFSDFFKKKEEKYQLIASLERIHNRSKEYVFLSKEWLEPTYTW